MRTVNESMPGEGLRPVGRPPAKHSSPDYVQMTVYVRKDLRTALKIRLFQEGLELSALVERLLHNWLQANGTEVLAERLAASSGPAAAANRSDSARGEQVK